MWVETCESRHKRVVLVCAIVVPVKTVGAVEFLAVNCQYNFLRFHDNSENS